MPHTSSKNKKSMKVLSDAGVLRGKRVLLRLDLNVPVVGDEIRDDFRIKQSLPTLQALTQQGAKVIVLAHMENSETVSLERVARYLNDHLKVSFVKTLEELQQIVPTLKEGGVVLFENLRLHDGEKNNDKVFA